MNKLKNYISINLLSIIGNIFLILYILLFFILLPLSFYFEITQIINNYHPLLLIIRIIGLVFSIISKIELLIILFLLIEILLHKFNKSLLPIFLQKYPNKLFIIGLLITPLPFAIYILRYLGY